jgi:hypothetical protein
VVWVVWVVVVVVVVVCPCAINKDCQQNRRVLFKSR